MTYRKDVNGTVHARLATDNWVGLVAIAVAIVGGLIARDQFFERHVAANAQAAAVNAKLVDGHDRQLTRLEAKVDNLRTEILNELRDINERIAR